MSYNCRTSPKCYSLTIANGTGFGGANLHDFAPQQALFAQIQNLSHVDVSVRLNGDSAATFTVYAQTVQVFTPGDLDITSIDFANTSSGAGNISVDLLVGLATV